MNHYIAKPHEIEPLRSGTQTLLAVVVKPQPTLTQAGLWHLKRAVGAKETHWFGLTDELMKEKAISELSPYQPGQLIAVKETWAADLTSKPLIYAYKSDTPDKWFDYPQYIVWKSPATMPLAAVRLHLRVGAVSVVRVQDVTEEQAKGLVEVVGTIGRNGSTFPMYKNYQTHTPKAIRLPGTPNAVDAYRSLFNATHGPGAWDANPFLFLIEVTPDKP